MRIANSISLPEDIEGRKSTLWDACQWGNKKLSLKSKATAETGIRNSHVQL